MTDHDARAARAALADIDVRTRQAVAASAGVATTVYLVAAAFALNRWHGRRA
ncbi:hypothetical protein AB0368_27765 [Actinoplanes sp. NPDC051475]|uniref:hypothetical protein n=1 Tax=Actinoplanes sp. NPDC051475 TaxID=3157225 RepID=UPI00344F57C4